jgi:hypothetical protein
MDLRTWQPRIPDARNRVSPAQPGISVRPAADPRLVRTVLGRQWLLLLLLLASGLIPFIVSVCLVM